MNVAEYKRKKYKEDMTTMTPKQWFGMSIGRIFVGHDTKDSAEYKEYKGIKTRLYARYAGGFGPCQLPSGFHFIGVETKGDQHILRTIDNSTVGRFYYDPKTSTVGFAEEADLIMFTLSLT